MAIKLGDKVLIKGSSLRVAFEVTGFCQDEVILRGVSLPLVTKAEIKELIPLNNKRIKLPSSWEVLENN